MKKNYIPPRTTVVSIGEYQLLAGSKVQYYGGEAGAPTGDFDFESIDEE